MFTNPVRIKTRNTSSRHSDDHMQNLRIRQRKNSVIERRTRRSSDFDIGISERRNPLSPSIGRIDSGISCFTNFFLFVVLVLSYVCVLLVKEKSIFNSFTWCRGSVATFRWYSSRHLFFLLTFTFIIFRKLIPISAFSCSSVICCDELVVMMNTDLIHYCLIDR